MTKKWMILLLSFPWTASATIINGINYELDKAKKVAYVSNRVDMTRNIPAVEEDMGNVVIPESVVFDDVTYVVTGIKQRAFRYAKMYSVIIPKTITDIPSRAFLGCDKLIYMNVDSRNPIYDSRDNCNAIIETKSNTLIAGCKKSVIPSSVTAIGERAFEEMEYLSLSISPNITTIGDYAFANCSIKVITLNEGVKTIGSHAFYDCNGLEKVNLPSSLDSIGSFAFAFSEGYVLDKNNKLQERGPASITIYARAIGDCAFLNWTNLTEVTLNEGVKTIGNGAFHETNLKAFSVPSTVEHIGYEPVSFVMSRMLSKFGTVYSYATTPPTCPDRTWNIVISDFTILYVPLGSRKAYMRAPGWNRFKTVLPIDDSVDMNDATVLRINDNTPYYDLQGRRVQKPKRGLYIRDGRKYVVK